MRSHDLSVPDDDYTHPPVHVVPGLPDPDFNNKVEMTHSVGGLVPHTTYDFRIQAINKNDDEDERESEWAQTNGDTLGERDSRLMFYERDRGATFLFNCDILNAE